MPEPSKPALSAEEWEDPKISLPPTFDPAEGATLYRGDDRGLVREAGDSWYSSIVPPELAPKMIALLNASLPDSDPRKITREMVADLRLAYVGAAHLARHHQEAGDEPERQRQVALAKRCALYAGALKSYLPPEHV